VRGRPRQVALVYRDVGLFIAPSRHVRDRFMEEGLQPSKVVRCGHGIDHELRPSGYAPKRDRGGPLRCGFIGTIAPHKGIDVLLEAFAEIENASVAVYGVASPAYAARARAGKIRFMGELSDGQKAEAFAQMDVLIVPSIWFENHSLVTLEAFLFGVPVVASDIGALTELVDDGRNGLLFRPGDSADLRAKIEGLAGNRDEVRRLAANVPPVKSTREHAAEIEELYERVRAERRNG
jgi:glycosyltransferase involved in cell wall biosynthesis